MSKPGSIALVGFCLLGVLSRGATADPKAVITLVPDRPGPYVAGTSLNIDFWVHSQVPYYVSVDLVQFDFTTSNPAPTLGSNFVFDYSSVQDGPGYTSRQLGLPMPWTWNGLACLNCPGVFLALPASGSLHVGRVPVQLPNALGTYRIDAFNAAVPGVEETQGGIIGDHDHGEFWEASTGEIVGGTLDLLVSIPVPAVSTWGLGLMAAVVLSFGARIILRRRHRRDPGCFVAIFCVLAISSPANAQADLIPFESVSVSLDSGVVSASGSGTQPVLLFSDDIQVSGGAWIQVRFAELVLSGSSGSGNASFVRISSEDGSVQLLDAEAAAKWGNNSAFLNGDIVTVELFGYPGSGSNRVRVEEVLAGAEPEEEGGTDSICGPTDDRVPSDDPRVGRTTLLGCSAFLFNSQAGCFLTAGHCCGTPGDLQAVEFNVPLSGPRGELQHPGPEDQYPIDPASIRRVWHLQVGDDWCIFSTFANTKTGLTALEAQGASHQLAGSVPLLDYSSLSVTGYGIDTDPPGDGGPYNEYSQTQQTGSGTWAWRGGYAIGYVVDMRQGASGGPVVHDSSGLVYAINTTGDCHLYTGSNSGTRVDSPTLLAAIACPFASCYDCNGNGILDHCDLDCEVPCGGCNPATCGQKSDCNANGIPDECDITSGFSHDCDPENGVPDECESVVGSCCIPWDDPTCEIRTRDCCEDNGGLYTGYTHCYRYACSGYGPQS